MKIPYTDPLPTYIEEAHPTKPYHHQSTSAHVPKTAESPAKPASPTSAPPPVAAGTPISIVILVGIFILFVNCCAMGGVYYQRDKIRLQSRLLRRNLRPRKAEEHEEKVSEAPSSSAAKKPQKKKGSRSDFEPSDEIHSDTASRTPAVSRESSMRRKHSQPAHDGETPKGSLKNSKSVKSGHKRHKSETSIYSEIGRTADVEVHAEADGPSRPQHRKNPTVKFNTLAAGLPPKALTKSTTSITSKASIKSNSSHVSLKSTTSRSSMKSTSSEKPIKKNASCQSLPTAEYGWGITPEMTMTERDDPEGWDDHRGPADRQQTLVAMQKLNYPKVLPDRPEGVHAATLPKMRPPPPPRSTSLTARDIQELEEKIQVVYRKKNNQRRDTSSDSCDLSVENIYVMGGEAVLPASMYGAPAATATVNRTRSRKNDGTADYVHGGSAADYVRSGPAGEYGRQGLPMEYGRPVVATEYGRQGGGGTYGGYSPYEPTYIYKDGSVPSSSHTPTNPQPPEAAKTYGSYGEPRPPRGTLATFGKKSNYSPEGTIQPDPGRRRPNYESNVSSTPTPNPTAVVTAAAQTALATATAPAFVGASNSTRTAPRSTVTPAPPPAATRTVALRQQSSTASGSDTGTVYEQSENTGTIKRKKSVKKESVANTVFTAHDTDKAYDKPLKGVLKQTSAYDKPIPLMAKAPGASPSASASSLSSSSTSPEVGSGSGEASHEPLQKTPSMKKRTRVATPGIRRKNKTDNHTVITPRLADPPN